MQERRVPGKGKGVAGGQLFNELDPKEEERSEEYDVCCFPEMKVCLTADGEVRKRGQNGSWGSTEMLR